jgi:hypothetical protein
LKTDIPYRPKIYHGAWPASPQTIGSHSYQQIITESSTLTQKINAGGLINVYSEYNGYVRENAMSQTENIYNTILEIYKKSERENVNNQQAAILHAEKRIHDMMLVHSTY